MEDQKCLSHMEQALKVGQCLGHKPVILNRSAAEVKNLTLDRRFGHCNVRFFASLRSAQTCPELAEGMTLG